MHSAIRPDARRLLRAAALFGALLCAACSGSGEGLDENGRPIEENPDDSDDSLFTQIQETVFTPQCTGCHQGANAPLGLRLDAGNSYAQLVGVPSVQVPALLRVNAGLPDDSYLVQKIEGTAAVGERMPLGGPPLPQASIDLIRSWIAGGAQPPPTDSARSFLVKSSTPAPDEITTAPLTGLTLVFSAPVDAALAAAGTIELQVLVDTTNGAAWRPVVSTDVTVSMTNPTVVSVSAGADLAPGRYRLRVRGNGPTALADVHARVLDGDADGVAGGDYLLTFDLLEASTP